MTPPDLASLVQVNLGWGKDRAKTIGAVAESMGIARRQVERAVETLRLQGVPVLSCSSGVYLSWDGPEIAACADALEHRLRQQYATIKSLRETAIRYGKVRQMDLGLTG